MGFSANSEKVRDLALYRGKTRSMSLRNLAILYLNARIQKGAHDTVENARAAMAVYRKIQDQWETDLRNVKQNL